MTHPENPFQLFEAWYKDACSQPDAKNPTAFCLCTIDLNGNPDGRELLLKGIDTGFVFFTNSLSVKGRSLAKIPKAAMVFYWEKLGKQIRIQGDIESVSEADSDAYFQSRHRISQLGAWASDQSQILDHPDTLMTRLKHTEERFGNGPIPRPPHWRGYRLLPLKLEFWLEGEFRLHERLMFFRHSTHSSTWTTSFLHP